MVHPVGSEILGCRSQSARSRRGADLGVRIFQVGLVLGRLLTSVPVRTMPASTPSVRSRRKAARDDLDARIVSFCRCFWLALVLLGHRESTSRGLLASPNGHVFDRMIKGRSQRQGSPLQSLLGRSAGGLSHSVVRLVAGNALGSCGEQDRRLDGLACRASAASKGGSSAGTGSRASDATASGSRTKRALPCGDAVSSARPFR